jgi:hypothetical protein
MARCQIFTFPTVALTGPTGAAESQPNDAVAGDGDFMGSIIGVDISSTRGKGNDFCNRNRTRQDEQRVGYRSLSNLTVSSVYTNIGCNNSRNVVDWGANGLICYGAGKSLVIFDAKQVLTFSRQ